ncbi:MAG: class I SAM-dependent methyltransferase [Methanophagales archaeon]|nr:class I SAM-dependent methyltransferase [Methanophagales archaeon]
MSLLENEVELVEKLCERIKAGKEKVKQRVLDVGCGTGRLSVYLSEKTGCDVTGIDMVQKKIEKARNNTFPNGKVEFEVQSAEKLAFANDTFDAVVSLKALHEMANPKEVLEESNRVLKARGRILLIDWVGGTAKTKSHAHALKYFTRERLEEMLLETGFLDARVELNEEGELMLVEGRKETKK